MVNHKLPPALSPTSSTNYLAPSINSIPARAYPDDCQVDEGDPAGRGAAQRNHVPYVARAEVVKRLCDRVAIIHDGKLVKLGTIAELRTGSETLEDVFVRVGGRGPSSRDAGLVIVGGGLPRRFRAWFAVIPGHWPTYRS